MPCESSENQPPKVLKFVAIGRSVMRGAEHIATTTTPSWAQRIAHALNFFKAVKGNWR
jgi:hypothetical protein